MKKRTIKQQLQIKQQRSINSPFKGATIVRRLGRKSINTASSWVNHFCELPATQMLWANRAWPRPPASPAGTKPAPTWSTAAPPWSSPPRAPCSPGGGTGPPARRRRSPVGRRLRARRWRGSTRPWIWRRRSRPWGRRGRWAGRGWRRKRTMRRPGWAGWASPSLTLFWVFVGNSRFPAFWVYSSTGGG